MSSSGFKSLYGSILNSKNERESRNNIYNISSQHHVLKKSPLYFIPKSHRIENLNKEEYKKRFSSLLPHAVDLKKLPEKSVTTDDCHPSKNHTSCNSVDNFFVQRHKIPCRIKSSYSTAENESKYFSSRNSQEELKSFFETQDSFFLSYLMNSLQYYFIMPFAIALEYSKIQPHMIEPEEKSSRLEFPNFSILNNEFVNEDEIYENLELRKDENALESEVCQFQDPVFKMKDSGEEFNNKGSIDFELKEFEPDQKAYFPDEDFIHFPEKGNRLRGDDTFKWYESSFKFQKDRKCMESEDGLFDCYRKTWKDSVFSCIRDFMSVLRKRKGEYVRDES